MPREKSAAEWQELARQYYEARDYEKARTAYDTAIVLDDENISALEGRYNTHIKLTKYRAALRDAETISVLEECGVRGCLLQVKLLMARGALRHALNTAQEGIENARVPSENLRILRRLHKQLSEQLSAPTGKDPFHQLPPELIENILSYLTFKNLVRILRVAKHWHEYMVSRKRIWQNPDFSEARRRVGASSVRAYVRRANGGFTSAVLYNIASAAVPTLEQVATTCTRLERLSIINDRALLPSAFRFVSRSVNLKILTITTLPVELGSITQLLDMSPLLVQAEFDSVEIRYGVSVPEKPLTSVKMLVLNKVDDNFPTELEMDWDLWFERMPNLVVLRMTGWIIRSGPETTDFSKLSHLKELEYGSDRGHDHHHLLPPSLLTLRMGVGRYSSRSVIAGYYKPCLAQTQLPHLQELGIIHCGRTAEQAVRTLLREDYDSEDAPLFNYSMLKKFSITSAHVMDDDRLEALFNILRLKDIEELEVVNSVLGMACYGLSGEEPPPEPALPLLTCEDTFPELKRVRLINTDMDNYAIKSLILGRDTLEFLHVKTGIPLEWQLVEVARVHEVEMEYILDSGLQARRERLLSP